MPVMAVRPTPHASIGHEIVGRDSNPDNQGLGVGVGYGNPTYGEDESEGCLWGGVHILLKSNPISLWKLNVPSV